MHHASVSHFCSASSSRFCATVLHHASASHLCSASSSCFCITLPHHDSASCFCVAPYNAPPKHDALVDMLHFWVCSARASLRVRLPAEGLLDVGCRLARLRCLRCPACLEGLNSLLSSQSIMCRAWSETPYAEILHKFKAVRCTARRRPSSRSGSKRRNQTLRKRRNSGLDYELRPLSPAQTSLCRIGWAPRKPVLRRRSHADAAKGQPCPSRFRRAHETIRVNGQIRAYRLRADWGGGNRAHDTCRRSNGSVHCMRVHRSSLHSFTVRFTHDNTM